MDETNQPPPFSDSNWYYAGQGKRVGPLSYDQILHEATAGVVTPSTPVWNPGLKDWSPARDTAISQAFQRSLVPPPLAGAEVDNSIVWALALAPIWVTILLYALGLMTMTALWTAWWPFLLANIGLALWDNQKLTNAGYNTNNMGWLAVLLVPGYLWVRATRVRQSRTYFWVWCGAFVVSLFLT